MSESLKRLVNIGTFNILQDKLEDWLENFRFNTCDQNVARGCEIIELNAKVQGQLFKLLNLCASEGGIYGGASVIKSRLLPILGQGFLSTGVGLESSLRDLEDTGHKTKGLKNIKKKYDQSLDDFESDLNETKSENETLRMELEEAKIELDRQGRQSSSEKMFDQQEIRQLKDQLDSMNDENIKLKSKTLLTDSYEHELEHLKEDVAMLSTHRSIYDMHSPRCHSQHSSCHAIHDPYHHSGYPLDCCKIHVDHYDPLCHTQQHLVSKVNDLFSISRVDAMNSLTRYSDDHENNQKIIFHSVMESFNAAKSAFRTYKSKIRSDMIGRHSACSLEESVQHYINNHADHEVDLINLSKEVVRALDFKSPLISKPSGIGFDVIVSFIREACKIAWSLISLPVPLDIYHPAAEGELYDESRYRRSYDSDYTAAFVLHHIWPCLVKNGMVIAKGEVVTKKAGSRAKSTRSGLNPLMSVSRTSDQSPSPTMRNTSPMSFQSKSPTSKRHY